MKKEPLSERQKEIYNFFCIYFMNNKLPPTMQEMQRCLGFASPNAAAQHLQMLERKGWLVKSKLQPRYVPVSATVRCKLLQEKKQKNLQD